MSMDCQRGLHTSGHARNAQSW